MPYVNPLAAAVAAASSFLMGGLWYSDALFKKSWAAAAGIDAKAEGSHPARVFGLSYLAAYLSALVFSAAVGPRPAMRLTIMTALLVGVGFVAASFAINYAFASRKGILWLIDAGYHVMQFLLYAVVFGLWPD